MWWVDSKLLFLLTVWLSWGTRPIAWSVYHNSSPNTHMDNQSHKKLSFLTIINDRGVIFIVSISVIFMICFIHNYIWNVSQPKQLIH